MIDRVGNQMMAPSATSLNKRMPIRSTLPRYNSYDKTASAGRAAQDRQQTRSFTRWWNLHLAQHGDGGNYHVQDLFEDIKSGILPIKLLEVLSDSSCGKVPSRTRPLSRCFAHRTRLISGAFAVF